MLQLAAVFFVLALVFIGLDLSGLRFAHGGGVVSNVFLLLALVCVVAKGIRVSAHHQ